MNKAIPALLILFLCGSVEAGIDFNGIADIGSIADNAVWSTTNYTTCMWTFFPSIGAGEQFYAQWKEVGATKGAFIWIIDSADSDKFVVNFPLDTPTCTSGANDYRSTASILDATWTHLCFAVNGSDYTRLYINGVNDGGDESLAVEPCDSDSSLKLGGRSSGSLWADVEITEFAHWTTNLLDAEIAQLASSRVKSLVYQIRPSSLEVYYPLDKLADGTVMDSLVVSDESNSSTTLNMFMSSAGGGDAIAERVLTYP